ncbi:MAG: hypothetical protein RL112_275 [Planctomycetota bacterium]
MKSKLRQPLMLATLAICVLYLVYRALYTLNLENPYAVFASLLLYLAEVWGCVSLGLFFLQIWEVDEPAEQPVLEGRTVDVFVPTYNEDVQLLRGTLQACVAMEYPHRTYVLDDGRRPEVKALAEELGVVYIARDNNLHAKAGNMNNALEQTDGEFVIIFDADHVPARHFIKRLIGYFRDEDLAMVQTPHAFYNFDTFQGVVDYDKGRFWDEGQLFYRVLQPGKIHSNSVIFAGSAAMFRRQALKEVGYIAVQTITEDMHTGMKIASRGWKSTYVSERMIAGQGASDVTTFHTQRLRWGEGNLSILAYDNPLTMKGLTLSQRLSYLASIIHWAGGIPKMAIYLTPILMLFTGIPPVREFTWAMGAIFAAYMLSIVFTMNKSTDGQASMGHVEFFNMASFWTQARSTWRAVFGRKKSKFVVTNKRGRQKASMLPLVGPQCFLIGLSAVALVWGWSMQVFFKDSIDWLGLGISSGLVLYHAKLALDYVRRAMTPPSRRFSYRHLIGLPARWECVDEDGSTRSGWGVTTDLNEQGLGLVAYAALPSAGEAVVRIMAYGNPIEARCKVRSSERRVGYADGKGPQCFRHGLEFCETDDATRDALHRVAMEYAVPMWFARFEQSERKKDSGPSSAERSKRETDRPEFNLPVILSAGEGSPRSWHTTSHDLCTGGLRCLLHEDPSGVDEFDFELPTPLGLVRGRAKVLRSEKLEQKGAELWECALHFSKFEGSGRSIVQSLLSDRERGALTPAMRPERRLRERPLVAPAFSAAFVALAMAPIFYGVFQATYSDELTLREHLKQTLAKSDGEELTRIYRETMESPTPDKFRLVLLKDSLERAQRWPEMVKTTRKLVELSPEDADMSMALAFALAKNGEHDAARVESARLFQLLDRQGASPARRLDAELLFVHNLIEADLRFEAAERYARLVAAHPDHAALRREYAGLLAGLGRYDEAVAQLDGLPLDADTRMEIVRIHCAREDFAKAEKACRELLESAPQRADAARLLPEILGWRRQWPAAIAAWEKLLEKAPKDVELRTKVASARLWSGDKGGALDGFQQLLDEGCTDARVVEGFLDSANGAELLPARHAHTVRSLAARAKEAGANDPQFLVKLAGALRRVGDAREAAAQLEAALPLAPGDKQIRLQLADTLHELGDYERADAIYSGLLPERVVRSTAKRR